MITFLVTALALVAQAPDTIRFTQGIEYRIEARLDETADLLEGRALLTYTNHAPVSLDTLWFHQHLNAFRPNSAWATRELAFGVRRFQDLGADDHAFERLLEVQIDGRPVTAVYPGAPDSTVVGVPLPVPLASGSTASVRIDWRARLSTTPRRQGRRDRHFDWAHWYPRVAAFSRDGWQIQPLLPQGEFFGEFGSYDVTLDLPADQVVGATGVPVAGDPGWSANARGDTGAVDHQSAFYTAAPVAPLGLLGENATAGRRHLRWRAEDVHHFAWSARPDFVYEGGSVARSDGAGGPIAIHVLYWPEDQAWAEGVALERTRAALEWLQGMFGPYPWPQLTNLHRLEPGGTEFPMLMMNGSPSEGLIVHEATHQYLHGVLANNEFREGWLDEGFTSFITDWYMEERGVDGIWQPQMNAIREAERRGMAEPIAQPGAAFATMQTYQMMSYTKASLVLRMLRWLIGEDSMRAALREFYDRHALQHVDERDFRRVVADVAGEDLDWFFEQWLHTTAQLDYGIADATTAQRADGAWVTRVDVRRMGEAWMPVTLQVGGEAVRLEARDPQQVVEIVTRTRPAEAVLDPEDILLDLDPANNRRVVRDR